MSISGCTNFVDILARTQAFDESSTTHASQANTVGDRYVEGSDTAVQAQEFYEHRRRDNSGVCSSTKKAKIERPREDCTTSTGQNLRLGYLRTPRARSVRERQKEMKLELKPRLGGWGKTTTDVGSRTDVFTHPLARNTVLELGAKEIEGNEESCVLPD